MRVEKTTFAYGIKKLINVAIDYICPLLETILMKLLIFDNHDSFTYNLVQIVDEWGKCSYTITTGEQIINLDVTDYDKLLISPGPGLPSESLRLFSVLQSVVGKMPVLGVCLGHQAIAEYFGGKLLNTRDVFHGQVSDIGLTMYKSPIFKGLPERFPVGRYHSWVVDRELPGTGIQITAVTFEGTVMAIQHETLPIYGVQFHPESVMTPDGGRIVRNWLEL